MRSKEELQARIDRPMKWGDQYVKALKWVLEGDDDPLSSDAVLDEVRALLKLWPKLKQTDMWGNDDDWKIVDEFEKQINKISEHFK